MELCLMPQYSSSFQIEATEIRIRNTHPLRTMIPNYVFPGLAYFFFNVGQYFYTSVSAVIQIYWCPIALFHCRIYCLEIKSVTFFLSSSFLPINCSPFTYICFWNQTDKYLSSSNFALAFNLPQVPSIFSWLFTWRIIQQFLHVMDLATWWSSKA